MFTASGWMSVDVSEKYHNEDNYYTSGKSIGQFQGDPRILKKLGIEPGQEITKNTGQRIFNKLLRGINPKTDKSVLTRKYKEGTERRAGFDLTLAPSKSVSLLYEFSTDEMRKAIVNAHQKATHQAMESAKKHISVNVPSTTTKNRQQLVSGEFIYAEIKHDVARENKITGFIDPLLHHHLYVFNMGLAEGDEQIRSINSDELYHKKTGENTHLLNQLGAEYRLILVNELEKIGITMEVVDEKQNFYEIKGVDRDLITEFSNRSKEVQIHGEHYLKYKKEKALKEAQKEKDEEGKGKLTKKEIKNILKKVEDDFGYRDVKIASQNNKTGKKHNVDRDGIRLQNRERFLDYKGMDSGKWVEEILELNQNALYENRLKQLEKSREELVVLAAKNGLEIKDLLPRLAADTRLWDTDNKDVPEYLHNVREILEEKANERAGEVVALAIKSIENESSLFNPKIILERAMTLGAVDKIHPEALKKEIEKAILAGELIPFALKNRNIVLSTKKIYQAEKDVFSMVEEGKGQSEPLLTKEQIREIAMYRNKHKDFRKMNQGQRDMVDFIFNSRDQFFGVMGDAGTGKTFSIALVKEGVEKIDPELAKKIIGISFTGQASAGLENATGIDSTTIDSFLMSQKNRRDDQEGGRIIIVDEATMVGSLKMKELFDVAQRNGDRVILVGDPKQFSAISAGSLFKDLLDNNKINRFELTETMRQKNKEIKKVIKCMKDNDYGKAVDLLKSREAIHEMEDGDAIYKATGLYIDAIKNGDMGDDIVDRSMIISSTNIIRNKTNEIIRQELKVDGIISPKGETFDTYTTVNVAGIYQYMATGVADAKPEFIIARGTVRGLKSNEPYEFGGVTKDKKSIILLDRDSKEIEINIERDGEKLGYYKTTEREFVENEVFVLTKNDKKLGFLNGMRGKILSVSKDKITVDIEGKRRVIDPKEYPYIDYGYAVTDYKSQGATTGHVIALAHPRMASKNSFYTQITRCKFDATVITSDIKKFTQNANKTAVAETTVGKKRLPNEVALESVWNKKIPRKEESVEVKAERSKKLQEALKEAAALAITIPDFVKKMKHKGIYASLRFGYVEQEGVRIKLTKEEIAEMKKQFRINYSEQRKSGERIFTREEKAAMEEINTILSTLVEESPTVEKFEEKANEKNVKLNFEKKQAVYKKVEMTIADKRIESFAETIKRNYKKFKKFVENKINKAVSSLLKTETSAVAFDKKLNKKIGGIVKIENGRTLASVEKVDLVWKSKNQNRTMILEEITKNREGKEKDERTLHNILIGGIDTRTEERDTDLSAGRSVGNEPGRVRQDVDRSTSPSRDTKTEESRDIDKRDSVPELSPGGMDDRGKASEKTDSARVVQDDKGENVDRRADSDTGVRRDDAMGNEGSGREVSSGTEERRIGKNGVPVIEPLDDFDYSNNSADNSKTRGLDR